ncbi:hypothetical protein A1O1_03156 [Capronia coronata CBS 617.96]|uniref:FAD dependent oxidoreductase domain-containing protein n=1 Tax=Capronia coronata CBS 617.96 TaxID=1182541 RepID=W9YQB9_9EURO|nr:uncharacterized protein A1O1_03156 [Capronia coronata CBS 617.96]EXJ94758.1 hypothetical protein A1O1_03156 [Capronia coronata CBS 617.96]
MVEPSIRSVVQKLAARLEKDPGTPVANATPSFWQDPPHPFADQQSANLPTETDVVIIGSGISAISTAQHLLRLQPSLKICMLEARRAISGATGRNGGHIKAVPWGDYSALKDEFGKESAMRITSFRLAHLDALVEEAKALGEAGKVGLVRRVQSLSAVYDQEVWESAKVKLEKFLEDFPEQRGRWFAIEGVEALKELGIANAFGAISGPSGAAWPYRFLGCILQRLLDGAQLSLETHTVAEDVRRTPPSPSSTTTATAAAADYPYEVITSRGTIRAKHVIHCTNAHAAHLLPALRGKLWPLRGQMTVQAVPPDFPRVGAQRSWSAIWARGFDYITQSPGDDGSLYLGGGFLQGGPERDEDIGNTDDSQLSVQSLEHLETVPAKAFVHGEGSRIVNKWTGIMGFTGDGSPLVGRVGKHVSGRDECDPQIGGEWIAAGYDGYGMVHCWLSGKALAAMVTGRDEVDGIREWFPMNEYSCTEERLQNMSPMRSLEQFFGVLET